MAGNHDTYFKNTNDVNSVNLLLGEYASSFNIIDHPSEIYVGPHKICMVPWICAENYEDSMKMLQETDAKYCMGHFEISGFAMYRGMPSEGGLDRGIFRKFSHTFSGHYHHRSTSDDIHYVGNPYELTWQDYNDARGFHIFDLDSDRLDFVKNPNVIFHKIKYDDKEESITDITNKDLSVYTGTYVKVVVINKTNPYLFDKFMNSLYNVNPVDITIAEDFTELTEGINHDGLLYNMEGYEVQVVRLDTFCELNKINNIDYLHMDVQGGEHNVIKGLGNYRPYFIFAETCEFGTYETGTTLESFESDLFSMGYEVVNRFRDDTLYKLKNQFEGFYMDHWLPKI